METLKNYELFKIIGGYWWQDAAGYWHYSPDDEEPDDGDIVG